MSTDATPTNETFEAPPLVLAPGVVLNDRWRMHRCLASGGYGDVWSAQDLADDNHDIAIKILRTDAGNNDPSALARMRQEAEILVRLDHPNIVKVFGFHESRYGEFLVMELLQGYAIDQVLQSDGPAGDERAIPVVYQLLGALGAAHADDILHRDIKPENIILARTPQGEVAKLLDFGIAKAKSPFGGTEETGLTLVQTRAGGFMGTPRYTAPEQAVGDPMAANADLFALGLVIAEWLTGKVRLDGERHADVMSQLLSPDPIDVSDTSFRWQRWLKKLLEKDPKNRFSSAAEAAQALEEWVVQATKRPDFLDDGYFNSVAPAESTSAFGDFEAPLELDLERVPRTSVPAPPGGIPTPHAYQPTPMPSPMPAPVPTAQVSRRQAPGRSRHGTEDVRGRRRTEPKQRDWVENILFFMFFISITVAVGAFILWMHNHGYLPVGSL